MRHPNPGPNASSAAARSGAGSHSSPPRLAGALGAEPAEVGGHDELARRGPRRLGRPCGERGEGAGDAPAAGAEVVDQVLGDDDLRPPLDYRVAVDEPPELRLVVPALVQARVARLVHELEVAHGADPVRGDEHVVQVRLHVPLEPRPRALQRPAYVVRADREPPPERRPERFHVGRADEHRVVRPAAACHAVPLSTMLQYLLTY